MKRIDALDGIRGLAIIFVLLIHLFYLHGMSLFSYIINRVVWSLWVGVDLFFVLSGFLITRNLLNRINDADRMRRFFWSRILRICPLYYFVLGLSFMLNQYGILDFGLAESQMWYFTTYTFNILTPFKDYASFGVLGYFWSLCVEMQFYLLWPFCVFWIEISILKRVCIFLIILSLVCRVLFAFVLSNWTAMYIFFPCRLDGLICGSYLAIHMYEHRTVVNFFTRKHFGILTIVLLGIGLWYRGFPFGTPIVLIFVPTLISLWYIQLLIYSLSRHQNIIKSIFECQILRFFGRYSYGIYVYHQVIRYILVKYTNFEIKNLYMFVIVTLLTIVISFLSYHLLEVRFLKLKDTLQTSKHTLPNIG